MKTINKIVAAVLLLVMVLSLTACGQAPAPAPTLETGSEISSVADTSYDDDLNGLCKYMIDNKAITGEPVEMTYGIIGAIGGRKYTFKFNDTQIQAEFYEFDLSSGNEEAQRCRDEIIKDGKFKVLDTEVEGYISDSQKYIMVYSGVGKDDVHKAEKERVIKLLKEFKA